jgi:hypothetical protein
MPLPRRVWGLPLPHRVRIPVGIFYYVLFLTHGVAPDIIIPRTIAQLGKSSTTDRM